MKHYVIYIFLLCIGVNGMHGMKKGFLNETNNVETKAPIVEDVIIVMSKKSALSRLNSDTKNITIQEVLHLIACTKFSSSKITSDYEFKKPEIELFEKQIIIFLSEILRWQIFYAAATVSDFPMELLPLEHKLNIEHLNFEPINPRVATPLTSSEKKLALAIYINEKIKEILELLNKRNSNSQTDPKRVNNTNTIKTSQETQTIDTINSQETQTEIKKKKKNRKKKSSAYTDVADTITEADTTTEPNTITEPEVAQSEFFVSDNLTVNKEMLTILADIEQIFGTRIPQNNLQEMVNILKAIMNKQSTNAITQTTNCYADKHTNTTPISITTTGTSTDSIKPPLLPPKKTKQEAPKVSQILQKSIQEKGVNTDTIKPNITKIQTRDTRSYSGVVVNAGMEAPILSSIVNTGMEVPTLSAVVNTTEATNIRGRETDSNSHKSKKVIVAPKPIGDIEPIIIPTTFNQIFTQTAIELTDIKTCEQISIPTITCEQGMNTNSDNPVNRREHDSHHVTEVETAIPGKIDPYRLFALQQLLNMIYYRLGFDWFFCNSIVPISQQHYDKLDKTLQNIYKIINYTTTEFKDTGLDEIYNIVLNLTQIVLETLICYNCDAQYCVILQKIQTEYLTSQVTMPKTEFLKKISEIIKSSLIMSELTPDTSPWKIVFEIICCLVL